MKILLLSGGIESTCLAISWQPDLCFTVDYGQVSAPGEVAASRLIARHLRLDHEVARINLNEFGAGLLSGRGRGGPTGAPEFWPFRNQMLITLAAMRFDRIPNVRICIGTVLTDRRHPDGTIRFLRSMNRLLQVQRDDFVLEYPAARSATQSLIEKSHVDHLLGFTFSCHTGPISCGRCPGCIKNLALREWSTLRRLRQKSRASHQTGSAKLTPMARASG
jgi:7-cyano-7-deazaguanine synthase